MHVPLSVRLVLAVLLAVLVLSAAHPAAVQPAQNAPAVSGAADPTFTTATNLIVLHVNVLDGRNQAVMHLPRQAFQVFEDGVAQSIEFFGDGDVPLAAGLVIDNSTSMQTRRAMVRSAVQAFADSSRDEDELFTILFNEHVRMGLPQGVPFTRNRSLLLSALSAREPGGLSAIRDAVVDGLSHLASASLPRRVLVVLSDGQDNASRLSESNMLYRASQSSARIFTIWTGDVSGERGNPGLLRRLAERSGGAAYTPRSATDVIAAFADVARSTRYGYSLGYSPTNAVSDGTYRRIKVTIEAPGKPLTARTREGYTAPDEDPATPPAARSASEPLP